MEADGIPGVFTNQKRGNFLKNLGLKQIVAIVILLLLLLGGGGYVFLKKKSAQKSANAPFAETLQPSERGVNAEDEGAQDTVPLSAAANFQSENFHIGEVAIGGEAEFLLGAEETEPFEITAIHGEAFTEKNKPEVKLVVTWRTSKLAQSEISYSKGVGQASKAIKEDDFSVSHSVIIPGLDQAATYVYTIQSHDRFGNEITSDPYAVYTGSRTVSLFDLIADAIGDVFGWAVKKK